MWYPATVTTPAASEPVTLAQAKTQCGVSTSDHDTQINALISAARAEIENYCGIKLVTQTVAVKCDSFDDLCRIPVAPLQSVSSLQYVDTAGDTQTVTSSVYEVRNEGLSPAIILGYNQNWPAVRLGSRLTLTAVVGYEDVPADIQQAALLMIGQQFSLSRRDLFVRSETVEGVGSTNWGGTVEISEQIRHTARSMLENYRNWPLV